MIYPGDQKVLVLSITNSAGTAPSVTVPPQVSVIQVATQAVVLPAVAMTYVSGTQAVYFYNWITTGLPVGDYLAIVSYAADTITINGTLLEAFHLGDTNITGPVALNSTVALNSSVAKDATVAHTYDLASINPNTSPVVLAIQASTANLPQDPASLTALSAIGSLITSIYNYEFGTWTIDKTQNPQVLTILAPGSSSVVGTFTLTDSSTETQRSPQ